VDTDGLRVGLPGATRMFCGEPGGLMDQEIRFLFLLEQAAGMRRQEQTLSLLDESGEPLLLLRPMS
jgi:heat shock protein HslJ